MKGGKKRERLFSRLNLHKRLQNTIQSTQTHTKYHLVLLELVLLELVLSELVLLLRSDEMSGHGQHNVGSALRRKFGNNAKNMTVDEDMLNQQELEQIAKVCAHVRGHII